jgi:hypothetical protein
VTALDVAVRQQQLQDRYGTVAAARALVLWRRMRAGSLAELVSSWLVIEALMARQVAASQIAAAATADQYLDALAVQYGERPAGSLVAPDSVAGVTGGGWPLRDALVNAVAQSAWMLRQNVSPPLALLSGGANLTMHVATEVADAGRAAEQVAMTARSWPTGYVRMVEPGACSRCIILAGKRYKWNKGFDRHNSCRCVHIPSGEDSDAPETNPQKYFDKLSPAEQDRVFGKAGAEAIRAGADMGQIVNARLGITTATVGGRQVQVTTQGTSRKSYMATVRKAIDAERGTRSVKRPRLMPEAINRIANGDRDMARRLLISNGYIVGDISALAREAA